MHLMRDRDTQKVMHAPHGAGCSELYMGDRGIEKIRGFEPYVSLESLWLNNNRLKKINNLDANFRIKALYAQASGVLKGTNGGVHAGAVWAQQTTTGACAVRRALQGGLCSEERRAPKRLQCFEESTPAAPLPRGEHPSGFGAMGSAPHWSLCRAQSTPGAMHRAPQGLWCRGESTPGGAYAEGRAPQGLWCREYRTPGALLGSQGYAAQGTLRGGLWRPGMQNRGCTLASRRPAWHASSCRECPPPSTVAAR